MMQNDHGSGTPPVSTSPPHQGNNTDFGIQDIKCNTCDKVFTRLDHLRRHERAHSAEKPFACSECERRFARLDVLRRHQSSHEQSRKAGTSDSRRRYSRACIACASARVRCMGGLMCHRCRSRGLQCKYPPRRDYCRVISDQDEAMIEKDNEDSSTNILSSLENQLQNENFAPVPKESIWSNNFGEMDSHSNSVGQSRDSSASGVTPYSSGVPPHPSSEHPARRVEDQLLPKTFVELDRTIIAGACLIPHVSESNVGSIYNYSKINWLPRKYQPQAARLSIPDRQKLQNRLSLQPFKDQDNTYFSTTSYENLGIINIYSNLQHTKSQFWASESYFALLSYLKRTPWRKISVSEEDTLPSLEDLKTFAVLYFERFHGSFPLLHKGTFLNSRNGCLLELAISAIGACYAKDPSNQKCSETLHMLLHKLLKIATISDDDLARFPEVFGLQRSACPERFTHLQAQILNVLGMFHSANPILVSLAREDIAVLVTNCVESKLLLLNHYDCLQGANSIEEEGDQNLMQWLEGELKCRAGYFIWMLDCMMAYESDFRTHMDLSDGKAPLPCPEQIWDDPMPPMAQLLVLNNGPPSLCFALDVLYTEKVLVPNLGELGRILLIHGMYRRVWEVTRYHSDRLSDWFPTSLSEPDNKIAPKRTTGPSFNPVVSRWINGSCDCLDVLHWSAKTTILQVSGLEHPTILHLHLSRLILLAPVSDLQQFAKASHHQDTQNCLESYICPTGQNQGFPKSLLEWAVHDQSKARLAIIHAGSVFWHLRRYSCGSPIETFAIYLATLVIWAYSMSVSSAELLANLPLGDTMYQSYGIYDVEDSCSNQDLTMQPQHAASTDSGKPGYHSPSSLHIQAAGELEGLASHGVSLIQLDRPCDDELVQLFVRFGDRMTPFMAQTGDIKCKGSPEKVLRQGIKLLSNRDEHNTARSSNFVWGAAQNFIAILSALCTPTESITAEL